MSACESGVADVKKQAEIARNELKMSKRRTLLFMDEIHRFTKTQQDAFLPIIENGTVVLIGATTENPSFSLNTALLSRCKTVVLEALSAANIRDVLNRGVSHLKLELVMDSGDSANNDLSDTNTRFVHINESALEILSKFADGDARVALNGLQVAVQTFIAQGSRKSSIDIEHIKESLQKVHVTYDRAGDQHYEIISAFHKSIRGSDDSAALYWLTRMLKGGEDPRYVARRLIVIASEDIGLGDPHALLQATAAHQAVLAVGMPECNVVLAQATVYLARARKSVEVYKAMKKAQQEVQQQAQNGLPPVPLHLRNASSKVMKDLGYGLGYLYNPDCKNGEDTNQTYLPEGFKKLDFFDDDDK